MQHFTAGHGDAAVFVLMLAEPACIPVPPEVIMLSAGARAAGATGTRPGPGRVFGWSLAPAR